MLRLRIVLALSHLCSGAGAIALYLDPLSPFIALLAVGVFLRWMVPSAPSKPVPPWPYSLGYLATGLLVAWLWPLGLADLLERAWHDRLSPRPLLVASGFILYLIIEDWRYFTRLTATQIDAFYAKRPA